MTDRKPLPRGLHATQYAPVHTSGHFRAMLEQIPEWDTAREALVNLSKLKLPASSGSHVEAMTLDVLDRASDGSLTVDDLLTQAADACRATEAADLAARVLDAARVELLRDLDAALEDNWPRLYGVLQTEHDQVWQALAAITDPHQLTDAETAVAVDRVDDYRKWRHLVDQHANVRARYATLSRHSGAINDTDTILTVIRNPDTWEFYPAWLDGHEFNHLSTGETEPITPPWQPHGTVTGQPFLLWVLASDFTPWLPTPTELRDAQARIEQLRQDWRNHRDPNQPLTAAGRKAEHRRVHGQMHTD